MKELVPGIPVYGGDDRYVATVGGLPLSLRSWIAVTIDRVQGVTKIVKDGQELSVVCIYMWW